MCLKKLFKKGATVKFGGKGGKPKTKGGSLLMEGARDHFLFEKEGPH